MHGLFYINIIYLISLRADWYEHDLWVRGASEIRVSWHKQTDFHATFEFILINATSGILRGYTLRPHIGYELLLSIIYANMTRYVIVPHARFDTANIPLNMRKKKLNNMCNKKKPNTQFRSLVFSFFL